MRENIRCNAKNIGALAHKLRVKKEFMGTILFHSKLFVITKLENEGYFGLSYLDKALESLIRKRKKYKDLHSENRQSEANRRRGS